MEGRAFECASRWLPDRCTGLFMEKWNFFTKQICKRLRIAKENPRKSLIIRTDRLALKVHTTKRTADESPRDDCWILPRKRGYSPDEIPNRPCNGFASSKEILK
jgi:hypothetical protein